MRDNTSVPSRKSHVCYEISLTCPKPSLSSFTRMCYWRSVRVVDAIDYLAGYPDYSSGNVVNDDATHAGICPLRVSEVQPLIWKGFFNIINLQTTDHPFQQ